MNVEENHKSYDELKEYIEKVKGNNGVLIGVLHKAQEIFGYLPIEVQKFIAYNLNLPFSQVYGVVTFYNFFSMKPKGKNVINVCLGTACYVKGAERVVNDFEDALGIKMGETTKDMKFTLSSARCFGACGLAPAVMVNEEVFGNVDKKKIEQILKEFGG
ncbi:MAG: NADH-quinone oxidoreductase subunit NuoE [Exilispira sp.]